MHLTGPGDPRAAAYRDIPDPQLLRAHGLFIAEGRLIVERLLTLPRFKIRSLLLNDAAYSALRDKLQDALPAPAAASHAHADAAEIDILIASTSDIGTIGGYDFHRGCLALVERPAPLTLEDLPLTGDAQVIVALEGIGNADNVGGIFRNAAALGARAVVLGPRCCDPLYRKATRTSMGATLIVPYASAPSTDASVHDADVARATATERSWPETLAWLRALGYRLVALTTHPPAVSLDAFATAHRGERLALLLGSEGAGLSDEALAAATDHVVIPMTGLVDSLNVATAAGVALHRLTTLG
jgi:tRNA G18 (ribose-2'-O)-methylase SpoU